MGLALTPTTAAAAAGVAATAAALYFYLTRERAHAAGYSSVDSLREFSLSGGVYAGVPVVAHIGSRPQAKLVSGRSRKLFKRSDIQSVVEDAVALTEAGAIMILLEAVPNEISQAVVEVVSQIEHDGHSPVVIGCGAGPACHGHVVVLHDILGLTDWHAPFAPVLGQVGQAIGEAAGKYRQLIESGDYLKNDHPYELEDEN